MRAGLLRVLCWSSWRHGLCLAGLVLGAWGAVAAPASPPPPMAVDLREHVQPVAVTVKDLQGRQQTRQIPVTWFRPAGDGPFPLAVISHGRDAAPQRSQPVRQRHETLARYLVAKGFAVAVPTRLGYGDTAGDFDPESVGSCQALQLDAMALAGSEQVLATVAFAKTLPWVDATRWVALGQSVGGLVTTALAARNPAGLVAAVSFSGGHGGNPLRRPGDPCSPQRLESLWRDGASGAGITPLWIYWANDLYWGADVPRRWARAWTDGGGRLEFHQLPAVGQDGHRGLFIDLDRWVPIVEQHLARAGFTQSGVPARPPVTDFARLDDVGQVPTSQAHRDGHYRRFLAAAPPRAFAIGPRGAVGWARGDWAIGHALARCPARVGETCRLYAVDDQVVWTAEESKTR